MKTAFADTGYWIALLNPRDELHDKALQVSRDLAPLQIRLRSRSDRVAQ